MCLLGLLFGWLIFLFLLYVCWGGIVASGLFFFFGCFGWLVVLVLIFCFVVCLFGYGRYWLRFMDEVV